MASRFLSWTTLIALLLTKIGHGLPTIDLKIPTLESEVDLKIPTLESEVDLKIPTLESEVDIKIPTLESEVYYESSSSSIVSSGDFGLDWLDIRQTSEANNRFALDLYREIATDSNNNNIFFSPYSVSNSLAMVHLGARGNTSQQIQEVMGFHSTEDLKLHKLFCDLNEVIVSSLTKTYSLRSANRIFVQEGIPLSVQFVDDTKTYFNVTTENLDFVSGKRHARRIINTWVREQTNGKIKNLIGRDDLDVQTVLVLINAVYFKAEWDQQFKKKLTRKGKFHTSQNVSVEVPMMHQSGLFPYGYDYENQCHVVELPYSDKVLSMMIVMPGYTNTVDELAKQLTPDTFLRWANIAQTERKLDVSLPKFSLSEQVELDSILKKMGLVDLFDNLKADLSGVFDGNTSELYVSKANHEASIDVKEEGSEATAATAVIMSGRSMGDNLYINRPFLFYIRHNPTDTILFLGRVTRPTNRIAPSANNIDHSRHHGHEDTFAAPAMRAPAAIEGRPGRSRSRVGTIDARPGRTRSRVGY